MAKVKREPFKIRTGNETIMFEATPREAARKVVRETRGTFDKTKRHYEQSESAHGSQPAKLYNAHDELMMSCRPTILGTRHRTARSTFAHCEMAPSFKRKLVKRRRR